ncbi:MAG: 2-oxoacid:acceptor oxidoreductase family protein, partial [Endomicrobiia bacterium]|nr:2-oxoacid:acceptor oxidoreductase family protein [Endomicrobiia bacterium]
KIIISGAGGQGVLFAGVLLAQGAMEAGKHTTFFPSYGAEIRGGAAMSSVIISDEPIGSPVVEKPDGLLVLNEVSFVKYAPRALGGSIVIVNTSVIKSDIPADFARIPASNLAIEKLGNVKTANVVMIGYYLKLSGILSISDLKKACDTVSKNAASAGLNKNALEIGYNYK